MGNTINHLLDDAGKNMRIYAVADLHGKPERMQRVRAIVARQMPDVLVVAGDLTGFFAARAVVSQLNDLGLPVLAVRGNTDRPAVDRLLNIHPNTTCLHLKPAVSGDVRFIGAGGTLPLPFASRIALHERPVFSKLHALGIRDSVLVVHPPPRGILDIAFGKFHVGCRFLRTFVLKERPVLLICGHVHEDSGQARLGETTVVNGSVTKRCSGARIEIHRGRVVEVEMLKGGF